MLQQTPIIQSVEDVRAFRLVHQVTTKAPKGEYTATFVFMTGDPNEVVELLEKFAAGQTDDKIVEILPPREVYERPRLTVTVEGFFDPDGRNVLDEYKHILLV